MRSSICFCRVDERGFALLDLLVAMVVVSLTMVAMAGVGQLMLHTSAILQEREARQRSIMGAGRLFSQFVRAALPQPTPIAEPLAASENNLSLWTVAPAVVGADKPVELTLSAMKNSGGNYLVIHMTDDSSNKVPSEDVTIPVFGPLAFSFLGEQGTTTSVFWVPTWTTPQTLPRAVKMSIANSDGQEVWDFVAAPLSELPVSCISPSAHTQACGAD